LEKADLKPGNTIRTIITTPKIKVQGIKVQKAEEPIFFVKLPPHLETIDEVLIKN